MKQIIFLFGLITIIQSTSIAQHGHRYRYEPEVHDKDYFVNKSKGFSTTGSVLLGGGAVVGLAGYFIYQNNYNSDGFNFDWIPGLFCMVVGGAAIITSVPMFIASSRYKSKAAALTVSFKGEKFPRLQGSTAVLQYVPAISVKIRL